MAHYRRVAAIVAACHFERNYEMKRSLLLSIILFFTGCLFDSDQGDTIQRSSTGEYQGTPYEGKCPGPCFNNSGHYFIYDENGNLVEDQYDGNSDGWVDSRDTYTYDSAGNKTAWYIDDNADGRVDDCYKPFKPKIFCFKA